MNHTVSKCPACGADSYDIGASIACPNPWHERRENVANITYERARLQAVANGNTMAQARALAVRARSDFLARTDPDHWEGHS